MATISKIRCLQARGRGRVEPKRRYTEAVRASVQSSAASCRIFGLPIEASLRSERTGRCDRIRARSMGLSLDDGLARSHELLSSQSPRSAARQTPSRARA
jgi:hypothetical protein